MKYTPFVNFRADFANIAYNFQVSALSIHLFNKCSRSLFFEPSTILGAQNILVNKMQRRVRGEFVLSWGGLTVSSKRR